MSSLPLLVAGEKQIPAIVRSVSDTFLEFCKEYWRPWHTHDGGLDGEVPVPQWKAWLTPQLCRNLPEAVVQRMDDPAPVRARDFAGPAIVEIWTVCWVQWVCAAVFPFVVCFISDEPQDNEPFASYPFVANLIFLPVIGYAMLCEWKALRWLILSLVHYLGPFKVFGRKVSLGKWLFLVFAMSAAMHLDLVTNGLFVAKLIKTVHCGKRIATTITQIWAHTIETSCFWWVPGLSNLGSALLICWGVMFLQPVLCWLYVYPLAGYRNTNYEPASTGDTTKGAVDGYLTPWSKLWGSSDMQFHADVVKSLASTNRMVSVTDKGLEWTLARATKTELQLTRLERAYYQVEKELTRIKHRLYLMLVLEKLLLLEVQTSVFAISRSLMSRSLPWRCDGQMLFSLVMSFVTAFKTLYDCNAQRRGVNQFCLDCEKWQQAWEANGSPDFCSRCMAWHIASSKSSDAMAKRRKKISENREKLGVTQRQFLIGIALLMIGLLHCTAKFVMAWVCRDSLWNIHLPFLHSTDMDWKGCVDLRSYLQLLHV